MRATKLVPDYADVYRDLAKLYERQGRPGARLYAEAMLDLVDRSSRDAIDKLEQATSAEPGLAEAYEALGMAYEAESDLEKALASYRRALELKPDLMLSGLAVNRLAPQ